MSKHKIASFVFEIVIIAELILLYLDIVAIQILVFTGVLFSLVLAFGSYYLRFQYFLPSISKLNNTGKTICLTFDDGPNKTVTPKLLEILKKHNVKVMFFGIGSNIEENIDIAKSISEQGHILGNHTYSHSNTFALSSYKNVENEIIKTNELIESITQQKTIYFRPPFGVTNPIIAKAVANNNIKVMGWSFRSFDTVISSDKLLKNLKTKVKPNDIILLHDIETSLQAVDEFIYFAKQKGFKFVLP